MGSSTSCAQITSADSKLRPLDVVAADLLRAGKVAGGIEVIVGCNEFRAKEYDAGAGLTANALTHLSQAEHSLSWNKRGDTYTDTVRAGSSPSVTSATLP